MKTRFLLAACLLIVAAPLAAQQPTQEEMDKYMEMARQDVRKERANIVGAAMNLSASDASRFWPIYEEYEAAFTLLGDEQIQIITDYAAVYQSMTDEAAQGLAARAIANEEDYLALKKEYHSKVEEALGGAVAARFLQVENRIGLLIDMQIAAEIPLLEPPRGG